MTFIFIILSIIAYIIFGTINILLIDKKLNFDFDKDMPFIMFVGVLWPIIDVFILVYLPAYFIKNKISHE